MSFAKNDKLLVIYHGTVAEKHNTECKSNVQSKELIRKVNAN